MLAWFFGASNEMDAFVVAFRVPNLVRDLFAEGAMSAAFVPTFTRQLTLKGKADNLVVAVYDPVSGKIATAQAKVPPTP